MEKKEENETMETGEVERQERKGKDTWSIR